MMLRNRRDLIALAHLALCWWLLYMALAHGLPWVLLATFAAVHAVAIAHNHAHVPLFRGRLPNALTDLVLQATTGIPQLFWHGHHLRRHHAAPWTEHDWSSPYSFDEAAPPSRPVSQRYFARTYLPLFVCESLVETLRRRRPRELRRLALSAAGFLVPALLLGWWFGPLRCLLVFGLVYFKCGAGLGYLNYLQHWACYRGDGEHWAWTFTCRIHNFLTYNSGYHMLHHVKPGLHWSELPAAHRADPGYTRPDLVEDGLFPGYRGPRGRQAWLDAKLALQEERLGRRAASSRETVLELAGEGAAL
jgi:fatty acid desaturase